MHTKSALSVSPTLSKQLYKQKNKAKQMNKQKPSSWERQIKYGETHIESQMTLHSSKEKYWWYEPKDLIYLLEGNES